MRSALSGVVVSGWPGAGKSTIADAVAAATGATVVSFDWIMSGLRVFPDVWQRVESPVQRQREVGWALMSRVAEQQLRRGASVVFDLVARDSVVDQWSQLAAQTGADFIVIGSRTAIVRSRGGTNSRGNRCNVRASATARCDSNPSSCCPPRIPRASTSPEPSSTSDNEPFVARVRASQLQTNAPVSP